MRYFELITATGFSLLFLALMFIPMERVFPAKPGQKIFRPYWAADLCYFLGQYLLWSGLVLWTLSYFSQWLQAVVPLEFRNAVASQPWLFQVVEVIVLSDI